MTLMKSAWPAAWVLLAATSLPGLAQFTNRSSVLDGSGALSSGGSFTNISAAGQPGGVAVSSAGSLVNFAGFLNTFSLKPDLDTDQDGLADEVDLDNDGDQLADQAEISGSGFSPATSTDVNQNDSDGDGIPDGDESAAGTDPTNSAAYLRIVSIGNPGPNPTVSWVARQNKVYTIKKADGSYAIPDTATGMSTGGLAAGVWQVTTNSFTDTAGGGATGRYYSVQTVPQP